MDEATSVNLHAEPWQLAGAYANYCQVAHTDYEFTLTFGRIEYGHEGDEIPGVLVTRVNMSYRLFGEMLAAMSDNWSKMQHTQSIRSLPEVEERPPPGEDEPPPNG